MRRVEVVSKDEAGVARKVARWEFLERLTMKFPDPEDKERQRIEMMLDDWWPMEDDDER